MIIKTTFKQYTFRIITQTVIAIAIVFAAILFGVFAATQTASGYITQADVIMETKIELLGAHLELEEFLAGDRDRSDAVIAEKFHMIDKYLLALLEGGVYYEGDIEPLTDTEVVANIEKINKSVAKLKAIQLARMNAPDISKTGLLKDKEYDEIFNRVMILLENSESQVRHLIRARIENFIIVQLFLGLFIAAVFWRIAVLRYRHELKRESLLENLGRVNEELELSIEDARQASKMKTEFLANMSHELRTPLHGILSFARLGESRIETASLEKLAGYFSRVTQSGERLLHLLNDLLDLSKLEAGQMQLEYKYHDLAQLLKDCAADMAAHMHERHQTIEWQQQDKDMGGEFDPTRIRQVINNLLSNAIKFSPPGSQLLIEMERRRLSGMDWLSVAIQDQGEGIPEDEIGTIFDEFVQSSQTRSGSGGTGLGLAITREILELHHGHIYVDSAVGKYARFTFEIPARELK